MSRHTLGCASSLLLALAACTGTNPGYLADDASAASDGAISCGSTADCPQTDGGDPIECCGLSCSDTAADRVNCGACGIVCNAPNAGSDCRRGKCVVSMCNPGFADCDGLVANGCETPIGIDVKNCGACGRVCSAPNATSGCSSGACMITACAPGSADCDMVYRNGCEALVSSNLANCGGCGNVCPAPANASATCTNGTCVLGACNFGFADCNHDPKDGCEVNLLSPSSCGQCGNLCPALPHASPGCNGGTCGIGVCDALYGDCDAVAANGCERDLSADVSNCGACGRGCVTANAAPGCLGGLCVVAQCNGGFADCNMNPADGCEADVAVDAGNCGKCGSVCIAPANSAATCSAGSCGFACQARFADCDKNAANGCERNLDTDADNCGACNNVCPAVANGTRGCLAGKCGVASCSTGFADCDGNPANGCEKNTVTDTSNCGACGNVCTFANANAACLNSQCGILSCKTGFADCDMQPANGCEKDLNNDPTSCSACNKVCGAMTPNCAAGVCVNNPCKGVVGGVVSAAMGSPLYGFCWYLGTKGSSCDQVCAATGGTNQANNAVNAFADDCNGGAAGQPATFFYQNGNQCNWTGPTGASTGYKTLGHGYTNATYYGKCVTSVNSTATSGTWPGQASDRTDRCLVCACSQ